MSHLLKVCPIRNQSVPRIVFCWNFKKKCFSHPEKCPDNILVIPKWSKMWFSFKKKIAFGCMAAYIAIYNPKYQLDQSLLQNELHHCLRRFAFELSSWFSWWISLDISKRKFRSSLARWTDLSLPLCRGNKGQMCHPTRETWRFEHQKRPPNRRPCLLRSEGRILPAVDAKLALHEDSPTPPEERSQQKESDHFGTEMDLFAT